MKWGSLFESSLRNYCYTLLYAWGTQDYLSSPETLSLVFIWLWVTIISAREKVDRGSKLHYRWWLSLTLKLINTSRLPKERETVLLLFFFFLWCIPFQWHKSHLQDILQGIDDKEIWVFLSFWVHMRKKRKGRQNQESIIITESSISGEKKEGRSGPRRMFSLHRKMRRWEGKKIPRKVSLENGDRLNCWDSSNQFTRIDNKKTRNYSKDRTESMAVETDAVQMLTLEVKYIPE